MTTTAVDDPNDVTVPSPAPAAEPPPRRRPAMVVAGSLLAGLLAAVALVIGPLAGSREAVITGGLLLRLPGPRALLAGPSMRHTHPPPRRAALPPPALGVPGARPVAPAPGSVGRPPPPPPWASRAPGSSPRPRRRHAERAGLGLAAAAARPRHVDHHARPPPARRPPAAVAAVSHLRGPRAYGDRRWLC